MIYVITFIVAVYSWTLAEYVLHRFLGHELKARTPFKVEHMEHHKQKDYFAKNWMKALSAIVAGSGMFGVLSLVFPLEFSLTYTCGFLTGYMGYEYFHRYFHIAAPTTKLGIKLRKHHFYHHFSNPNLNHGVTTTFWDKVFNTYYEPATVDIHQRFAMDWLKNSPEQYAKDYVIKSKTAYT